MKTIVALATPRGRSGVAIVRVSGPQAYDVISALCGPVQVADRVATFTRFKNPRTGELLDKGILVYFKSPHSFTGEDVAEFHLHGSPSVIQDVLHTILRLPGIEPAEPGAFTRQAFSNGKLDLTEVEGLIDLIDAETSEQRRQALRALDGHISTFYTDLRIKLIQALAYFEAAIDFVDGEIDEESTDRARQQIDECIQVIDNQLSKGIHPERLRDGYRIALLGAPNAGKSTLLNALAKRDVAIVSSTPGTTRDLIEVHLDISGFPVTVADTAGLRETSDTIEKEGISRAVKWANQADLCLYLYDCQQAPQNLSTLDPSFQASDLITVGNKIDLVFPKVDHGLSISLKTGEGLDLLLHQLKERAEKFFTTASSSVMTRERHRHALVQTLVHLRRALIAPQVELAAEDLRLATRELGRVTGKIDVEDLLDVIFSDFCIGK